MARMKGLSLLLLVAALGAVARAKAPKPLLRTLDDSRLKSKGECYAIN